MNNGLFYYPPGPDQLRPAAIIGAASGLIVQSHASSPNTKLTISAGQVLLESDTGQLFLDVRAVNVSVDITVSGLGGGDGFTEAAGTWYYVWLAGNGNDVGALLSLSSTAPSVPAGYDFKALLGAVLNDGAGNLQRMFQTGGRVFIAEVQVFDAAGAVAYTALSLASAVPPIARTASGTVGSSTSDPGETSVAGDANGVGATRGVFTQIGGALDDFIAGAYFEVPLITAQTLYHKNRQAGAGQTTINVSGYTL